MLLLFIVIFNPDTIVYQLEGETPGGNEVLRYSVNANGVFLADSRTGEVRLVRALDYEVGSRYN